ncbi:uncharacterized protein LOC112047721 [Bicyclus anynana]|uniref:Uncharacterized protein LOC112047721 n=1 Tax=Bicyclus anynana TaxID=110368 RepID=A0A6J1N6I1_BICAN|nr:uncharacterized protein LOC112047721 [Bicyclus anynana]
MSVDFDKTFSGVQALTVVKLVLQNKQTNTWRTVDVMYIGCALVDALLLACGALTAGGRVTRMAEHLEHLERIDSKCNPRLSGTQHKLTALVLFYILGCIFLRYYEFTVFKERFLADKPEGWVSQAVFVFMHLAIDLLVLQLSLAARAVQRSMRLINDSLQRLIPGRQSPTSEIYKVSEHTPKQAWKAEEHNARKSHVNFISKRSQHQIVQTFSDKVDCGKNKSIQLISFTIESSASD